MSKSYAVNVCGIDFTLVETPCAGGSQYRHEPEPAGYLERFSWAQRKLATHHQARCPGCGLFAIWVPREHKPLKAVTA